MYPQGTNSQLKFSNAFAMQYGNWESGQCIEFGSEGAEY